MTPLTFDPYHRWLGIPPHEMPADPWRLLGLSEGENDERVIRAATDQRLAFLRTLQHGQFADASQRLLNEVSRAGIEILQGTAVRAVPLESTLRHRPLPTSVPSTDSLSITNSTSEVVELAAVDDDTSLSWQEWRTPSFWRGVLVLGAVLGLVMAIPVIGLGVFVASRFSSFMEVAKQEPKSERTLPEPAASGFVAEATDITTTPPEDVAAVTPAVDEAASNSQEPAQDPAADPAADDAQNVAEMANDAETSNNTPSGTEAATEPDPETDPESITVAESADPDLDDSDSDSNPNSDPAMLEEPQEVVETLLLVDLNARRTELMPQSVTELNVEARRLAVDRLSLLAIDPKTDSATRIAAWCEIRLLAWLDADTGRLGNALRELEKAEPYLPSDLDPLVDELSVVDAAFREAASSQRFARLSWMVDDLLSRLIAEQRWDEALSLANLWETASKQTAAKPFRQSALERRRTLSELVGNRPSDLTYPVSDEMIINATAEERGARARWEIETRGDALTAAKWLQVLPDGIGEPTSTESSSNVVTSNELQAISQALWESSSTASRVDRDALRRAAAALQLEAGIAPSVDSQKEADERLDYAFENGISPSRNGRLVPSHRYWSTDLQWLKSDTSTELEFPATAMSWSARKARLAVGLRDGRIVVVNPLTGSIQQELDGHDRSVLDLDWLPGDSRIVSTGSDSNLRVNDVERGTEIEVWPVDQGEITQLAISVKPRAPIAAGSDRGRLFLINSTNGQLMSTDPLLPSSISAMEVSLDGRRLVCGDAQGEVRLMEEGGTTQSLSEHSSEITTAMLSDDGEWVVTGDARGEVIVSIAEGFQSVAKFQLETNERVLAVAFWPYRPVVLAFGDRGTLVAYDLARGAPMLRLTLDENGSSIPETAPGVRRPPRRPVTAITAASFAPHARWLEVAVPGVSSTKPKLLRFDLFPVSAGSDSAR